MSRLGDTLSDVNLDQALDEAKRLGVRIAWVNTPSGYYAAYQHKTRTIYLSNRLHDFEVLPNLLHELEHAKAGHDGPQPRATEERINETVAQRLITPSSYATAEKLTDGNTGAIALELDLPHWVVAAYQRLLLREPPRAIQEMETTE